jgi:glutamate dehydrogenase
VLLGAVVADGEMTGKQRDRLLAEMTDEVAELVLLDNYLQTQAISVAEALGADLLEPQIRFMRGLEREGRLDRAVEHLPDDEALAERVAEGRAFTRPELSVLLAYAKMALYDILLQSDVPEDPYLSTDLAKYFPRPLRKRFDKALQGHRLRREIIATFVANSMINRAGITILHDIIEETGMPVTAVARAYAVTRDGFGLRSLWTAIQDLDNKVPAVLQSEMTLASRDLVQHATLWFLRNAPKPIDIAGTIDAYQPGIAALEEGLEGFLGEIDAVVLADKRRHYEDQGVPEVLARRVAALEILAAAPDIVLSAAQCEKPIDEVARVYFAVGATLGLDWLRAGAERIEIANHWERMAITAIVEDFYGQQRALTNVVLRAADGADGEAAVAAWGERRRAAVERSGQLIDEFKAAGGLDIPKLAIANRHFRTMIVGT